MWREFFSVFGVLRRRPLFASAAILTIVLGGGASVTVFSYLDALLFRALPFPDADRLVYVSSTVSGRAQGLSYRETRDLLERAHTLSSVAAYSSGAHYNLTGGDTSADVRTTLATADLFTTLGVRPILGELWPRSSDESRSFDVVLTHDLWQRYFRADPEVVGRQIVLVDVPYTVRGVLPPGFDYPDRTQLFRSWGTSPDPNSYQTRRSHSASVVARLRNGANIISARRELNQIAAQLMQEHPSTNRDVQFVVQPLRDHFLGGTRPYLILLAAAVVLVLGASTANVASLFLVRGLEEQKTTALRLALGASHWQAGRPLLWEGVVVTILGAIGALSFASILMRGFREALVWDVPSWMAPEIDMTSVVFLSSLALLIAVLSGAVSVGLTRRVDLHGLVKEGTRGTGRRSIWRPALVTIEIALATVLLIGAALLANSFFQLMRVDMGYEPANVLAFRVTVPWARYGKTGTMRFHQRALEELRRIPGVVSASVTTESPVATRREPFTPVRAEGQDVSRARQNTPVWTGSVSDNYFATMRIHLQRGRFFTPADQDGMPLVAIVDQTLADALWPGLDPIGRRVQRWPELDGSPWFTVVGVVDSVREAGPDAPMGPALYASTGQLVSGGAYFVVRTIGDPMQWAPAAEQAIRAADPLQAISEPISLAQSLAAKDWQRRIAAVVFTLFAALAAALAATGIFGMVAGEITNRTTEFGVRVALGASARNLLWTAARRALLLSAAGSVIGLATAWWLATYLSALVYGITPHDGATFLAVLGFLFLVAGLAAAVPSLRLLRLDPAVVLRSTR